MQNFFIHKRNNCSSFFEKLKNFWFLNHLWWNFFWCCFWSCKFYSITVEMIIWQLKNLERSSIRHKSYFRLKHCIITKYNACFIYVYKSLEQLPSFFALHCCILVRWYDENPHLILLIFQLMTAQLWVLSAELCYPHWIGRRIKVKLLWDCHKIWKKSSTF